MDGFGRAAAAARREDNGEEGALLGHAATEVLIVLLQRARDEEVGGVLGGVDGVGREQRAGDGDVDGGDGG